jgi:hypothetical protein
MTRSTWIRVLVVMLAVGWIGSVWSCEADTPAPTTSPQQANDPQQADPPQQDAPPQQLPDADRKILNQYLGQGVVGEAIPCPQLQNGFEDIMPQGAQVNWRMLMVSGSDKGKQRPSFASRSQPGPDHQFKWDTGDGVDIYFVTIDKSHDLLKDALQDNQESVITKYSPPEPMFLAGLKPGETRHISSKVSVAKLSNPQVETHHGKFEIDFTYIGVYRVNVPAGKYDAMLLKEYVKGHIGPASIQKTNYYLAAKNTGFVAIVEIDDVSALLFYQDHTREGEVLTEIKN